MDDFGTLLLVGFLERNCPELASGPREYASWDDVGRIFFEGAGHVRDEAIRSGRVWTPDAVDELDATLVELAESGRISGRFSIAPTAAEELWRRWSYSITAAHLEEKFGPPLMLPFPLHAPDEMKGLGLMLYILGGPARSYRHDALPP